MPALAGLHDEREIQKGPCQTGVNAHKQPNPSQNRVCVHVNTM